MFLSDHGGAGLCMAIRWRRGLARQESLPESLPSPKCKAATAHVKVTLKTKGGDKDVAAKKGNKGMESNSGSHIDSMGGSDMRISSLPAGAAGTGNSGVRLSQHERCVFVPPMPFSEQSVGISCFHASQSELKVGPQVYRDACLFVRQAPASWLVC